MEYQGKRPDQVGNSNKIFAFCLLALFLLVFIAVTSCTTHNITIEAYPYQVERKIEWVGGRQVITDEINWNPDPQFHLKDSNTYYPREWFYKDSISIHYPNGKPKYDYED